MTNTLVSSIFGVFTAVGDWMTGAFEQLIPVFYNAESGLTFMGILSCIALGVSIIFLILGVIQSFLHFRA